MTSMKDIKPSFHYLVVICIACVCFLLSHVIEARNEEATTFERSLISNYGAAKYQDSLTSKTEFNKVCSSMGIGIQSRWKAATCFCDATIGVIECSVRPSHESVQLDCVKEAPCMKNVSAYFLPHEETHRIVMDRFQLCVSYETTSIKTLESCVTLRYTNDIPEHCEIQFFDSKGGWKTCQLCDICGRYAFSVNCGNIFPLPMTETCIVFDEPEMNFFSQLPFPSQNQKFRTGSLEVDDLREVSLDGIDGRNRKTSESLGNQKIYNVGLAVISIVPILAISY